MANGFKNNGGDHVGSLPILDVVWIGGHQSSKQKPKKALLLKADDVRSRVPAFGPPVAPTKSPLVVPVPDTKPSELQKPVANKEAQQIKLVLPAAVRGLQPTTKKVVPPEQAQPKQEKASAHPTVPKGHETKDQINARLVAKINHFPFVNQEAFKKLSEEERQKHLQNDPFANYTIDERGELHQLLRPHMTSALHLAGKKLGLYNSELGFDPEGHADPFTERIVEEMRPHVRQTKIGPRYHQGIDTKTMTDLPAAAKMLAYGSSHATTGSSGLRSWAHRYLLNDQGYGKFTGHADIEKTKHIERQIKNARKKADELLERSTSEASEATGQKAYSLAELRDLAKDKGIRIQPEVGVGGVHYLATDATGATVAASTSLQDLQFKLGLEEPKAVSENNPVRKFHNIRQKQKEIRRSVDENIERANAMKFELSMAETPTDKVLASAGILGSNLLDSIQETKMNGKELGAVGNHAISNIASLTQDAIEAMNGSDYDTAHKAILKAENYINDLSDRATHKQIAGLKENLYRFGYAIGRVMERWNEQEHAERTASLKSELQKLQEENAAREEEMNALQSEAKSLEVDPKVSEYRKLLGEIHRGRLLLEGRKINRSGKIEMLPENSVSGDNEMQYHSNYEPTPAEVARSMYSPAAQAENELASNHDYLAYLFGIEPEEGEEGVERKNGLVQDVENRLDQLENDGSFDKIVDALRSEKEFSGDEPPSFMPIAKSDWKFAKHNLSKLDPKVLVRSAILFSDYNPVPGMPKEAYEAAVDYDTNPKAQSFHHGEEQEIDDEDEKSAAFSGYWPLIKEIKRITGGKLPPFVLFRRRWIRSLELMGNAIIEQLPGPEREMFDRIRLLARPMKRSVMAQKSGEELAADQHSGTYAAAGRRILDHLYGKYYQQMPHWVKEPHTGSKESWERVHGVVPDEIADDQAAGDQVAADEEDEHLEDDIGGEAEKSLRLLVPLQRGK